MRNILLGKKQICSSDLISEKYLRYLRFGIISRIVYCFKLSSDEEAFA